MPDIARPHVVIIGAGFGGLWATRTLAHRPVDVLLLDRNNYHTFLALLYQVSAAELEPEEIGYPVRSIVARFPNVRFGMDEVIEVDLAARTVRTPDRLAPYDYLILATGSATSHFGLPGAAEHTFGLKTLEDGMRLRNHILCCFERAEHEPNPAYRRRLLTFAVVGGGATGVEFSGALAELVCGPLGRDYPRLDLAEVRVVLVEATDRLLPAMPVALQEYTRRRLEKMGVEVKLQTKVAGVHETALHLQDGVDLPTETVVWTAGVRGTAPVLSAEVARAANGRIIVQPTLQLPDHPEVYVVGDLSYLEQDGRALPMIAPVAIQGGSWAARNILRQAAGEEPLPFHYRDKGLLATIGRSAAVAHIAGRNYTGLPAWLLWLVVHLLNLIGFRNRVLVLINWAWDYFFRERAVRLILPSEPGTPCGPSDLPGSN